MATTPKGIYYPDDYTAVADVPEDMKDLAESVDTALDTKVDKEAGKGLSTYNFGVVQKGRLDSLWQGKATVDSDIARIKATFPTTTGSGENITLQNTAELEFIQPPLPRGNSEQNGTPSPTNEVPITNVTGDVEVVVDSGNILKNVNWYSGYLQSDGTPASNSTWYYTDYIPIYNETFIYETFEISGQSPKTLLYDTNKNIIQVSSISRFRKVNLSTYNAAYIRISSNDNVGNHSALYQEQTYTFPLGTQRMFLGDYLADDGIHHVRGQKVYSGGNDESWNLQSINSNGIANFGIGLTTYSGRDENISLCNYFSSQNKPIAQTTEEGYYLTSSKSLYFRIKSSTASTVAEFKTWLSTHNVMLEYELATEEITPYTEPQQQAYDEIKQALSYEEQTNISGTSDESNPLFSVEAYQSIKLILESLGE